MSKIRRMVIALALSVLTVTVGVVVQRPVSAAATDPPPVLPACPGYGFDEFWAISPAFAGLISPATSPVGELVSRGLRQGCAFQGELLSTWTCVGPNCSWASTGFPRSVSATATPALVPVQGTSQNVRFDLGGGSPQPWPQCLPVNIAPLCGGSTGSYRVLHRFPNGAGTFEGQVWLDSTVSTSPDPLYLLVRQGTCDGGTLPWTSGQTRAIGTSSCTYQLRWRADLAGRPNIGGDLQLAVLVPWLRTGTGAVSYEGMPSTELFGGWGALVPLALDDAPTGVPSASMEAPEQTEPGVFTFRSTSTDSLNEVLTETWDFGDAGGAAPNTAQGRTVTHTYSEPGTYTVTLRARNQTGRESVATRTVTVAAPTLSLGVELLGGATPPLDENAPVDVRVTVRAGSDGVGALSDLTFTGGVVRVSPAAMFATVSGPAPAPEPGGFSLAPGASRTFDLRLQPQGVGRYTIVSTVAGVDAAGGKVEATGDSPGEVGSALAVTLAIDPPFADQTEGPNGPEPVDATLTITLENTTSTPMTSVNLRSFRVDRTKAGQLLAVTQTGGVEPDPTAGYPIGTLAPGEQRVLQATFRATDDAEVEFSAFATAVSDVGDVVGTRRLRWSVKPEYLLAFTSRVTRPQIGLLPAGEPFVIQGTVKNLSTSATVAVGPLYPELGGNAGVMTLSYDAAGQPAGTLAAPPELVLGPGEEREFNLKVTTGWSDPRGTGGVAPHGGTRARATFTPWGTATLEDGTVVDVTPARIRTTEADLVRTVSIDDSIAIPEFSYAAWGGAVMVGAAEGVESGLAALLHGLLGIATLPAATIAGTVHFQDEVWSSFTEAEKEAFANDVGALAVPVLRRNAELAARGTGVLFDQVKAATLRSMTDMANEWEVGDYTTTTQAYTRLGADAITQAAAPIALARLARSPQAVAALRRAQEAIQTRMTTLLAGVQDLERVEEALPLLDALENGAELSEIQIEKLYGITPEELAELQTLATKYRFLLTVRSRHASSIDWIRRTGALLKPEVLKLKSVSELDVRLGYPSESLGSLVFKKPEVLTRWEQLGGDFMPHVRAFLADRGYVENSPEWLKAATRLIDRSKEWRKYENDYKFWSRRGFIDVSFNYKGNAMADLRAKGRGQFRGFKLEPVGDETYVIKFLDNKTGRYVPVTGDIDPISFTHLDGTPLTAAEHLALMEDLRKNPLLQAQHGESATYVNGGTGFIESQFKPNEPGLQVGPGGLTPRAVRFNVPQSRWTSAEDYKLEWDGGFVQVSATPPPASAPLANAADVVATPVAPAAPAAPVALPGNPAAGPSFFGRCRLVYANTADAVPLFVSADGTLTTVVAGVAAPWAAGPDCLAEGPVIDVRMLPATVVAEAPVPAVSAAAAPSGTTRLPVSADPMYGTPDPAAGFAVGQTILVNPGAPTAEIRTVIGFGSLIVDRPFAFTHAAGEVVVVIESSAPSGGGGDTTTTTTMPATTTSTTLPAATSTTSTTMPATTTTVAPTTTVSSGTSTSRPSSPTSSSSSSSSVAPPTSAPSGSSSSVPGSSSSSSSSTPVAPVTSGPTSSSTAVAPVSTVSAPVSTATTTGPPSSVVVDPPTEVADRTVTAPAPVAEGPQDRGSLPRTGGDPRTPAAIAALLVVAGLLLARSRRRTT